MYPIDKLDMLPACAVGRFRREISHALATQRTLCVRTDAAFPSNIGTKGSRREESRIFFKTSKRRRSRCGTFGNCPFPYRLPTAIPAYLFQQAEVFEPADSASPLDSPPLSASDRGSKNIAEPARLRSLRASPLRSLFEAYCRTA